MTPEGAKSQLEEMLQTGKITQEQLEQAAQVAKMLAPQLGIK